VSISGFALESIPLGSKRFELSIASTSFASAFHQHYDLVFLGDNLLVDGLQKQQVSLSLMMLENLADESSLVRK
jgi:hypothetical protein